ncbi:MAG: helix-turn-helix domain-containing protein, partial [Myxococcota bacterium]
TGQITAAGKERLQMPSKRIGLIAYREALGLTQAELMELIDAQSVKTIQRWESGESMPSLRYRKALASMLKLSLTDLERILDPNFNPATDPNLASLFEDTQNMNNRAIAMAANQSYREQYGIDFFIPVATTASRRFRNLSPSELLHVDYGLVPYADVTGFLASTKQWCLAPYRDCAGMLIYGPGGMGKTRLTIELAKQVQAKGWLAGFLQPPFDPSDRQESRLRSFALDELLCQPGDAGVLFIVDYAEGRQSEIVHLARRLRTSQTTTRLVLLSRSDAWWPSLFHRNRLDNVFGEPSFPRGNVRLLSGIPVGDARDQFLQETMTALAKNISVSSPAVEKDKSSSSKLTREIQSPIFTRPLALQMRALIEILKLDRSTTVSSETLLDGILELEYAHWSKTIPEMNETREFDVRRGLAQITSINGITPADSAVGLLLNDRHYSARKAPEDVRSPISDLQYLYSDANGGIAALEPDLVGEHQVALTADVHLLDGCLSWIQTHGELSRRAAYHRSLLTVLQRATQPEHGAHSVGRAIELISHLVKTHGDQLVDEAISVALSTPGRLESVIDTTLNDSSKLDPRIVDALRTALIGIAYSNGDLEREARIIKEWSLMPDHTSEYYVQIARYAARASKTSDALEAAKEALSRADNPTARLKASIELAGALWAAGHPAEGLDTLKGIDEALSSDIAINEKLRVAYNHKVCLLLHDLDQNLQVAAYAERCISAYRDSANIEQMITAMVNRGDALWGVGRIDEARNLLEEAYTLAKKERLPHAIDISAICLANVLASSTEKNDTAKALILYDEGTSLAKEIGHDWDRLYGQVYRAMYEYDQGKDVAEKLLKACT